ncbi:DUF6270 domain-containing protein [Ornithinibacillus sp. 179-J 7C1 HS]|uniref:DUF6270 domain-containing protein n=1 Tax=Ornithinibacillus sp. 179-J 7C1 HS TaxID=3142384 RepID=UPI0039A1FCDB
MKINILGSCVTRDAFEVQKHNFSIENYFARTSIVSIMTNPIEVREDQFNLSSNFQKKCVLNDVRKLFFSTVEERESDYIIIDLIDERFNLLKINDSYITKSNELISSNFIESIEVQEELISNVNHFKFWAAYAKRFFTKLLKIYDPSKIIIHKTKWRAEYLDKFSNVKSFSNVDGIASKNRFLDKCYRFIEDTFPQVKIIDMTERDYYASENHKWGLAPYHFEDRYYMNFLRQLGDYTGQWVANYHTLKTKMGDVNIIINYDPQRTYLDSATASNISNTKVLKLDENGIPLLKVGNNGQYGYQYYPITIGIYGLECISKYYKESNPSLLEKFYRVCDYLIENQLDDGSWPVNFDYYYGVKESGVCRAPWVSALGQGFGISCLVRGYNISKNAEYLQAAMDATKPFYKDVLDGGVRRSLFNQFTFYEEYPTEKPTHILNGFMFSLLGLYDLYFATKNSSVLELYKTGISTLQSTLSFYDLGDVSAYDLSHITIAGNPTKFHYGYHLTHIRLLSAINTIECNEILSKVMNRWLSYANGNKSCHRLDPKLLKVKLNNCEHLNLLQNSANFVEINYEIEEKLEYAFYLFEEEKKVKTQQYGESNKFDFYVSNASNYKIIAFIRDQFKNAIYKEFKFGTLDNLNNKSQLDPEELSKHTEIQISNGKLKLNIENINVNYKFAYYLSLNGKNILKEWYSNNRTFEYEILNKGKYTVTIFCQDDLKNKVHFEKEIFFSKSKGE